jgi:uncharacterized membrane protein YfcA
MNKFGLLLCILAWFQCAVGQKVPAQSQELYDNLMKKSKKQKKTANVLLIGGGALTVAGAFMLIGNMYYGNDGLQVAGATAYGIGLTSIVTSVPFYISSASKRRKATRLMVGVGFEKTGNYQALKTHPVYSPALYVKFSIP